MDRRHEQTFPQRRQRWPTDTWKDAQHHSPSGKCKSKPPWYTTSHLLEWLKSKTQETSIGEDGKKKELLCTIANWCSHCGSSKIENRIIKVTWVAQSLKRPTLDLGSGSNFVFVGLSPTLGSALRAQSLLGILSHSFSLAAPPQLAHLLAISLSLSK